MTRPVCLILVLVRLWIINIMFLKALLITNVVPGAEAQFPGRAVRLRTRHFVGLTLVGQESCFRPNIPSASAF